MLQIKNLTYGYKLNQHVLENFSLEFNEPGVYGLLGKNGTGKSTLLYLTTGLLRPQSGHVTFEGCDTRLRLPQTLSEMFIVPEEYNLPRITLPQYVNVLKPFYPNFDEQLMTSLLDAFDMHSLGATDKNGIPEINLGALSMGQKKKVYICVALAARTKFLAMDEPTNGLDILSKSQFRKIIAQGMREDQIMVISTHQVRDVETLIDHVTIMNNNRVLLHKRLDMEAPVNLEELFINTIEKPEIGG